MNQPFALIASSWSIGTRGQTEQAEAAQFAANAGAWRPSGEAPDVFLARVEAEVSRLVAYGQTIPDLFTVDGARAMTLRSLVAGMNLVRCKVVACPWTATTDAPTYHGQETPLCWYHFELRRVFLAAGEQPVTNP